MSGNVNFTPENRRGKGEEEPVRRKLELAVTKTGLPFTSTKDILNYNGG
jgi:hypothetical protein